MEGIKDTTSPLEFDRSPKMEMAADMLKQRMFSMISGAMVAGIAMIAASQVQAKPLISEGPVAPDTGFKLNTVTSGLEHPWGMAWLPDGSMLITERPGRLRIVRNGTLDPDPIKGVPEVFASGQGGLLDVALHPLFGENNLVYLTYSAGDGSANRTTVARGVLDGDELRDAKVIFEVSDPKAGSQHFGSRLLWLPDRTLLVSIGDGGNPPVSFGGGDIRLQAQNLGTHFGKLLRINDDGSIPEDNPFVGRDDAKPEIWSFGHRNIQGLALDPKTGQIWANEHGALRGDELNHVKAGKNYGWPAATYSRNYGSGTLISPYTSLPGMIDPIVVWMSTTAPSGLAIYRGEVFGDWDGDILSGGLVTRDVRRLQLNEDGTVAAETSINVGARVRDVSVGPDGHIYLLTDESNGRLLRLEPQ